MSEEPTSQPQPVLPFATQPTGLTFLLRTWTGRIILVNAIVFFAMAWQSGSLVMPDSDVLMRFGAKDPVLLAQGEWWRFITPIFVHIGLIHFAFNTWALYVIAWQLEHMLRGRWFVALYLVSGLLGNIASSVFSMAISAGASSSLFGILGSGFLVERIITKRFEQRTGQRARAGAYTGMVVGNLVLGFLIPQIDNAAHFGGLVGGILFTLALLSLVPNRLIAPRRGRGILLLFVLVALVGGGAMLGSSTWYVQRRIFDRLAASSNPLEKYHLYGEALRLSPDDAGLHWERAKILIMYGYPEETADDLRMAARDPNIRKEMMEFQAELVQGGRVREAATLTPYLSESSQ